MRVDILHLAAMDCSAFLCCWTHAAPWPMPGWTSGSHNPRTLLSFQHSPADQAMMASWKKRCRLENNSAPMLVTFPGQGPGPPLTLPALCGQRIQAPPGWLSGTCSRPGVPLPTLPMHPWERTRVSLVCRGSWLALHTAVRASCMRLCAWLAGS